MLSSFFFLVEGPTQSTWEVGLRSDDDDDDDEDFSMNFSIHLEFFALTASR